LQLLGTPSEDRWPGVSQLPEYQPGTYPDLPRQDMAMYVPRLDRVSRLSVSVRLLFVVIVVVVVVVVCFVVFVVKGL
jgi:hypothetical protein